MAVSDEIGNFIVFEDGRIVKKRQKAPEKVIPKQFLVNYPPRPKEVGHLVAQTEVNFWGEIIFEELEDIAILDWENRKAKIDLINQQTKEEWHNQQKARLKQIKRAYYRQRVGGFIKVLKDKLFSRQRES